MARFGFRTLRATHRRTLALLLLGLFSRAASAGTWQSLPSPSGYNGQFGVMLPSTAQGGSLWIASGFTRIYSTPFPVTTPAWTPFPTTGLAFPILINEMTVPSSGVPVLSVVNLQTNAGDVRWWDAASATWKPPAQSFNFPFGGPRMLTTASGDVLISQADAVYASTDGGHAWALRSKISDFMLAPAPLPAGGNAAGWPGYLTNALTPTSNPGFTEAWSVTPWGEVFLGEEASSEWHSLDDGNTWEHLDPQFYVPIRDMAGVPLYTSPHRSNACVAGNTGGAGATKDAEVLFSCDQDNRVNVFRLTTDGLLVPPDPTPLQPGTSNLGMAKRFFTLQSGETLSSPVGWDASNGINVPAGRNASEIVRWDGSLLGLASPAAGGSWIPLVSNGSIGASDGSSFFTLSKATSQNLMRYVPDAATNLRPTIATSPPVTVTMDAATGLASLTPGTSFQVSDDGIPGGSLTYAWTARGAGPVTFDDPRGASPTAFFRVPGHYVLTLTVSDGQLSSGQGLLVHVKPASGTAPVITTQPKNTVLVTGQATQISLVASGTELNYRWFRNGIELVDGQRYAGTATSTLTILSPAASDYDSVFHCVVSSPFGRALSHGALLGGPVTITAPPVSATIPVGTSATLSVAADGSHPMRWQWYAVSGGTRTPIANGGNSSAFSTSTPGTYQVDVTNPFGTVTSPSASIANGSGSTFTLNVPFTGGNSTAGSGTYALGGSGSGAIGITTDRVLPWPFFRFSKWATASPGVTIANPTAPQTSITVAASAAGQSVSVIASYTSVPPVALHVVNGFGGGVTRLDTFAPGATVEVAAHPAPPGFTFDKWVGGPLDGSTSASASFAMPASETWVTATYKPTTAAVAPTIFQSPQGQIVNAGQVATFAVTASGTAPLGYQWTKNGIAIPGATGATYTTPPTQPSDDGALFAVTVTNAAGSVTSAKATLQVRVPPTISQHPRGQIVNAGQAATFGVTANGTSPLSYLWMKNGTPISGATGATYTTPPTQASDDGARFRVQVTNVAGTVTSSDAVLTVLSPPTIVSGPADAAALVGQDVTFSVTARGSAPLAYAWKRNGVLDPGGNAADYVLSHVGLADDGTRVSVVVSNAAGIVESDEAVLHVAPVPVAPTIAQGPQDVTAIVGQSATFTVQAEGTGPLGYAWARDGLPIANAQTPVFVLDPVSAADDGATFAVTVANAQGNVTSAPATLHVLVPPAIATPPQSVVVKPGEGATFTVVATGTAPLSYQWKRADEAISGGIGASYATGPVSLEDDGATFTVEVTNAAGRSESAPVTLSVRAEVVPPRIVSPPASVVVPAGRDASFQVVADGTGPLHFSWKRNGAPIAGANEAGLLVPSVGDADDGALFSVVVENAAGTVESAPAKLTVAHPPAIATQPSDAHVAPGEAVSFHVEATGSGPLAYAWKRDGQAISGANGDTYELVAALADDGARFSVTVSNAVGEATSAAAVLHVEAAPEPRNEPVSGGCGCASGSGLSILAFAALLLRRRAGASITRVFP